MEPNLSEYVNRKRIVSVQSVTLSAATATLLIIINFAAGLFAAASNLPGGSGLITGFTVPFFLVMLNKTTKVFGSMTICWVIYSTIAIPFHLMGPPNIFKPLFGLFIALSFELPIIIFNRKNISYYLGLLAYTASILGMAYIAFAFLNLPGTEKAYKYMWYIGAVFFIEGSISVFLAHKVYVRAVAGSRLDNFFSNT